MRSTNVVPCRRIDDKTNVVKPMTGQDVAAETAPTVAAITEAITGKATVDEVLAALVSLRTLRTQLDDWEPLLIGHARAAGMSWAEIAPALGVASRQAAERRFLRMHRPTDDDAEATRDQRVLAVRDRRARDRAVDTWARGSGADLRQLAGQITALTNLAPEAQPSLDRLHNALGDSDPATLVPALAATREHLSAAYPVLADRVAAVARDVDEVRQASDRDRAGQ
jgi:hypothetical protein